MNTSELSKEIQYAVANPRTVNMPALLELAHRVVAMLRMIDARRESGMKFPPSWNEDELRAAVTGMAQAFPPGPPMAVPDGTALAGDPVYGRAVYEAAGVNRPGGLGPAERADVNVMAIGIARMATEITELRKRVVSLALIPPDSPIPKAELKELRTMAPAGAGTVALEKAAYSLRAGDGGASLAGLYAEAYGLAMVKLAETGERGARDAITLLGQMRDDVLAQAKNAKPHVRRSMGREEARDWFWCGARHGLAQVESGFEQLWNEWLAVCGRAQSLMPSEVGLLGGRAHKEVHPPELVALVDRLLEPVRKQAAQLQARFDDALRQIAPVPSEVDLKVTTGVYTVESTRLALFHLARGFAGRMDRPIPADHERARSGIVAAAFRLAHAVLRESKANDVRSGGVHELGYDEACNTLDRFRVRAERDSK